MFGVATFVFAPIGAVLGHTAVRQIRGEDQHGASLARWAIIVGWSITGLGIVTAVLAVIVLVAPGSYYFAELHGWAT